MTTAAQARSTTLLALLIGLAACSAGVSSTAPPAEPEPVSAREALAVLEEVRAIAEERTPEAMEALCARFTFGCRGFSEDLVHIPESAPGPGSPPTVLCNLAVEEGARLLVIEGEDGYGRPYAGHVVFARDDSGNVVQLHEPAFWLGYVHGVERVVSDTTRRITGHPDITPEGRAELIEQARARCDGDDP